MKFSIIFVISFLHSIVSAQETYSSKTIIWQGFEHNWTYNHRLNRIGSFIDKIDENHYNVVHTSATGIGKDSTFAQDFYAILYSEKFIFKNEKISIRSANTHNNPFDTTIILSKDDNEMYALNGFDIVSMQAPSKLGNIRINIDNDKKFTKLHIRIYLQCTSAECFNTPKTFDYKSDFYLLKMKFHNEVTKNIYSYECHKKYSKDNIVADYNETLNNNEIHFIVGYEWKYDTENWLQQCKMAIENNAITLRLSPYAYKMKEKTTFKKEVLFSKYKNANSYIKLVTIGLKQDEFEITFGKKTSKMFWKGINKNSLENEKSIAKHSIEIEDLK